MFHFKPIKSLIKTFYNSHYMSCMSNISSPNWNALKEPKSKLSTYTYNYTQWTRKTTLLKVQFWKVSLIVRWKTTLFDNRAKGKKFRFVRIFITLIFQFLTLCVYIHSRNYNCYMSNVFIVSRCHFTANASNINIQETTFMSRNSHSYHSALKNWIIAGWKLWICNKNKITTPEGEKNVDFSLSCKLHYLEF